MSLYNAILELIAKRYLDQNIEGTEIILQKNQENTGGHCSERTFTAGILYKVILPVPLTSPENYLLVLSSGDGAEFKGFTAEEKYKILVEYEHDNNSFFLFFRKTMTCRFFTNRIPNN